MTVRSITITAQIAYEHVNVLYSVGLVLDGHEKFLDGHDKEDSRY